ncbi:hypothetical protein FQZ97_701700 [compost metagenome]
MVRSAAHPVRSTAASSNRAARMEASLSGCEDAILFSLAFTRLRVGCSYSFIFASFMTSQSPHSGSGMRGWCRSLIRWYWLPPKATKAIQIESIGWLCCKGPAPGGAPPRYGVRTLGPGVQPLAFTHRQGLLFMLAADIVAGSPVDDPVPVSIKRGSSDNFTLSDPFGLCSWDPFHREACTHGGTPCVGRSGTFLIAVPCRSRNLEVDTDRFGGQGEPLARQVGSLGYRSVVPTVQWERVTSSS